MRNYQEEASQLSEEVREQMRHHDCDRDERWQAHDGRGIPLCWVCDECEAVKMSKYRPEILEHYTQADVDEPIESDYDDGSW